MAVDNIIKADFHTDVHILPHKVTDVALMQLPDSPMELQPTFQKHFLPLHHVDSEHNLPHTQRASHTSPNRTGTSTTMAAESSQSQPQTTLGTSLDVPGAVDNDPTLHRFVQTTSHQQQCAWFKVAGPPPLMLPILFQSSQPVEMGDLFIHHLNGSVSFWVCTCTQLLTWEPIAIGDPWLLDHTCFLALQDEQPTWVLLETLERYKRYQRHGNASERK
ncbi:hypothetical protein EDC04DRAFT_2698351 [Pisolithus marmoratus]|nr:hypothetical protein EDC04DRAFT_2698351 [Pisolithus marmoratus]